MGKITRVINMDADTLIDAILADIEVQPDQTITLKDRATWHKKLNSYLSEDGEPELEEEPICPRTGLPQHGCGCEVCDTED